MNLVDLQKQYISKNKNGLAMIDYSESSYNIYEGSSLDPDYNVVLEIEEIEYDDYIYDIETEHGKFQAGIGDNIVFNTDSVFVTFNTPGNVKYKEIQMDLKNNRILDKDQEELLESARRLAMDEAFEMGKRASKEVTEALFKKPNLLEFEKVYNPLLLFGKKMYIAALHESDPYKYDLIDKKGVALKRRDNAPILKRLYNHVVDLVMDKAERGLEESFEYLDLEITKLTNNEIDFDELVISKTLKSGYKTQNIPHKILAEKMFERDPGSAPKMNERVPYIFVEHPNKRAKLYEKVEDPVYARINNLRPDILYYIDNQLKNPLSQFYGCLIGEEEIKKYFQRKIQYATEKNLQGPKCEAIYKSGEKKGMVCGESVKFVGNTPSHACGRHQKWFKI